jgi:mRNA interferase MazF
LTKGGRNKMMDLNTLNKLEELKKSMIIEENKNNNITKIEINIETKGNKDSNIFENKIYNKSIHSNISNRVARGLSFEELKKLKRGDIVWVDLRTNVGSEQSSDENGRPVVIIQNDIGNEYSPTIITACITSQLSKKKLPIHVEVPSDNNGLSKNSVVLTEQIMTLDKKKRILRKTGSLNEITMAKIDRALSISIFPIKEKTPLEKLPRWIRNVIIRKIENIHSFERAWLNSKTNNQSFKSMCLKERELCLLDLEEFCSDNELNYRDYYTQYSESESNAM